MNYAVVLAEYFSTYKDTAHQWKLCLHALFCRMFSSFHMTLWSF